MSLEKALITRSEGTCEFCDSLENLKVYGVPPNPKDTLDDSVYACAKCIEQIENPDKVDPNHWRCLNDSIWSPAVPVQVMSWRMLHRLRSEGWPVELLEIMYLDKDALEWAKSTEQHEDEVLHLDSNGAVLTAGDTVVLIKDLKVKGANFIAKRGTAVRRISLVVDNPGQIEGRVNGQQIVILTEFVKKAK
jgi:protein PhnA